MELETSLDLWLDMSHALFLALVPQETKVTVLAVHSRPEHAFLIHKEEVRVDRALVSMALSSGEKECLAVISALDNETVIALACRWGSYTRQWKEMASQPDKYPWHPPKQKDLWRAVLLSIVIDQAAQRATATRLGWAEFPSLSG